MDENDIGTIVVGCAINLHRLVGPGLFESVYEVLLCNQLEMKGLNFKRQVVIPIRIGGQSFKKGFRADIIVEQKVILELKSVEQIHPAYKKQVITYLKLTGMKLGYLLNFSAPTMKDGITRLINGTIT